MSVDTAFWIAGVGLEATVVTLLIYRRIARLLPIFTLYIAWSLLSDLGMFAIRQWYPQQYLPLFIDEIWLDSALQFGVLVELSWSVLRPHRSILPRATVYFLAGVILLVGGALWPVTGKIALPGATPEWHLLMRLEQTFSSLRILFFMVLAALSQVLALGWRSRELQIATGLGFYSLVSLGAVLVHTHHTSIAVYQNVDRIVVASGVAYLLYWVFCFGQTEAPRQEFSPKMQNLLFTVAGTARASRVALDEIGKSKR